jgi:hypothetical protein
MRCAPTRPFRREVQVPQENKSAKSFMADGAAWNDKEARAWCRAFNRENSTTWVERPTGDDRSALEKFCGLVEELENYPAFKNLLREDSFEGKVRVEDGKVVATAIQSLDEDQLRSFLLTTRMIYEQAEKCSILQIAPIVEKYVGPRNPLWWNGFNAYRLGLNHFMDGYYLQSEPISNREVFETFIYGHYSHRSQPRYEQWKKDEEKFLELKLHFVVILSSFFYHARQIRTYVLELLQVNETRE